MRLVGQAVKTLASHAENMGSIPVRVTKTKGHPLRVSFLFCRLVRSSNPAPMPSIVPLCTTYAFKLNFPIEPSDCALWVRISASPSRVETSWVRLIPVRVRTMFAPSTSNILPSVPLHSVFFFHVLPRRIKRPTPRCQKIDFQ